MSMTDPISDMLTRIRNAQMVRKFDVTMPLSKVKVELARVLKEEGFINEFTKIDDATKPSLKITLKYFEDKPVIEYLQRKSRPGLRRYVNCDGLPTVKNGLGIAIVSTSKGMMTARKARALGVGGEVLCYVS